MSIIKTELQKYKTQDGNMHIEIMGDGVMDLFGANLEQHAELIVRAVNSHAALVSALEGIVAMQDSIDPEGFFEGVEMAKCRAALAFVKAQQ